MAHIVTMYLSRDKMEAAGMRITETPNGYELSFRQAEYKDNALRETSERLAEAGFRARDVDEFLDDLVCLDNALVLMKLR